MLENNGKSVEWMGVLSKTRAVQKYRNPLAACRMSVEKSGKDGTG